MRRHYDKGERWEGLTCFERETLCLLRELANLSHRQFRELDRIRKVLERGGPGNPQPAVAFGMKFSKPKQEKD